MSWGRNAETYYGRLRGKINTKLEVLSLEKTREEIEVRFLKVFKKIACPLNLSTPRPDLSCSWPDSLTDG